MSVCLSVCLSVCPWKKIENQKNQKSLINFEYLINFAASLRIGSIEGGWGWGGGLGGILVGEKMNNQIIKRIKLFEFFDFFD